MSDDCDILGPLGFSIQILLGVFSFFILIYKRIVEKPKRQWKVWGLDTSKQGCSQVFAHFLNVALAIHLSGDSDECVWYLATLLLDTTIGVLFSYVILKLVELALEHFQMANYRSGNYFLIIMPDDQVKKNEMNNKDKVPAGTNLIKPIIKIDLKAWFIQLILWILVVSISKFFLFLLQLVIGFILESISQFILSPFSDLATLKLIIVMCIIPVFMNGLQFWIQDNFLKKTEFTIQEKKYVLSEMYVDEELTNFARLDNFVNNPEVKSDHCLDKLQMEMANVGVGVQQITKGYQKADFE
ncbi:unnamed protein product [Paramecium pentaurelia]|uniref:Vaculolar membrane protein n=1 Tax=Paramecium pentaurelia TaxID=43138 RepID=A0A8S1SF18_9CILI|nr:unnamed protein product [Paramecium pentaurelia]